MVKEGIINGDMVEPNGLGTYNTFLDGLGINRELMLKASKEDFSKVMEKRSKE